MSRNAYITEAFKQFNILLEEDQELEAEEMPIYDIDSEKMHDFLDTAGADVEDVNIFDLEAEAEEDLKQSYVGKVILDCNVCHSNIFIDKDEIIVDEDGVANIELECPYCMSNEGYTIIGKVEPYSEVEDETEPETEETETDVDVNEPEDESAETEEDAEDEITVDEGLITKEERDEILADAGEDLAKGIVNDTEFFDVLKDADKKLEEDIQDVTITTDDETMTMTTKEDGGISVETSPVEEVEEIVEEPAVDEVPEEELTEEPEIASNDEVIAPLDDEEENDIELGSEVEQLSDEEIEELGEPDETEDELEISEFDEDSFDELGESYLRKHYDNVNGFKTVNVKVFNDNLIVEGVIRFDSGASKVTSFIFEATQAKKNGVLFEGYNRQISRGKKTFKMACSIKEGMIKPTKLSYNYMTKNELNESVRVNGTCKIK